MSRVLELSKRFRIWARGATDAFSNHDWMDQPAMAYSAPVIRPRVPKVVVVVDYKLSLNERAKYGTQVYLVKPDDAPHKVRGLSIEEAIWNVDRSMVRTDLVRAIELAEIASRPLTSEMITATSIKASHLTITDSFRDSQAQQFQNRSWE